MHVNIVLADGDREWICGRLARELAARLPRFGIKATINGAGGDLTYHQVVYGPPAQRPAVGMFTHGEYRPRVFGPDYDGQVVLNPVMLGYLMAVVPPDQPRLIELPVADEFIKRPIVFGVSGRVYGDGRKGEHLVREMVAAGYAVRAWGHGWPCEIVSSDVRDLVPFYRSLDYYVDTSSDEGGCTPALECLALGVPVISHTLGVDRPVMAYETHDWPSLHAVLRKLTEPRTYDDWAAEHADYFMAVAERCRSSVASVS